MIEFKCASCDKEYKLPDNAAGRKARCKACGEAMEIPEAPDGLLDDGNAGGVDLGSLYASAESSDGFVDQSSPTDDGTGFNPEVSFQQTPRKSGSSGPPTKLIIGGVGGAVALLLVVVIIIVFTGGGGGDDKDGGNGNGLAFDTSSSGGGGSSSRRSNRDETDSSTDSSGTVEVDVTDAQVQYINSFGGTPITPTDRAEWVDWSLPASSEEDDATARVNFRGIVLQIPSDWEYEILSYEDIVQEQAARLSDGELDFIDATSDSAFLRIKLDEEQNLTVLVSPRPAASGDWPDLFRVDEIELGMTLSQTEHEQFEALALSGTDEQQFKAGLIEGMTEKLAREMTVAFSFSSPVAYYLNDSLLDTVAFGSLLQGHRFARIESTDPTDLRGFGYVGNVKGLHVVLSAQVYEGNDDLYWNMERIMRTATLTPEEESQAVAEDDEVYASWLSGAVAEVPFAETAAPLVGLPEAGWGDGEGDAPVVWVRPDRLASPNNKDWGIVIPGDLEIISTTRTAIRTAALDDGTWLGMEVHKLAGLERRQATPIIEDGQHVLMRGRTVPLPEGVEISELVSEHFTLHRLMYPEVAGEPIRRVTYLVKDGAHLITVMGRFPVGNAERLAMLDEAAKTVQPVKGE